MRVGGKLFLTELGNKIEVRVVRKDSVQSTLKAGFILKSIFKFQGFFVSNSRIIFQFKEKMKENPIKNHFH